MLNFGSNETIILTGRLGRDAETKFTQNGKPLTSFSVAVDKYNPKAEGENKRTTAWRDVVSFNEMVQKHADKLVKGACVQVSGSLNVRTWEDKEGKTRVQVEVLANDITILSRNSKNDDKGGETARPETAPAVSSTPASKQAVNASAEIDDSDIPF